MDELTPQIEKLLNDLPPQGVTEIAAWSNGLKKKPLDAVVSEVEAFVTTLLKTVNDPLKLLEIAEAIRSGIRQSQTTQEGIIRQEDAIAYLKLLTQDKKIYEKILLLSDEVSNDVMALAIHRNLATLIHSQLIHYQHYLPIPEIEWLRIHRLFYIAIERKLTGFTVPDKIYYLGRSLTVLNQYCISLLLGCGRLNHLSPAEINRVWKSLLDWFSLVSISRSPSNTSDNQLVVDITSGSAPNFKKLFSPSETSVSCYLQVDKLIEKLDSLVTENMLATAKQNAKKEIAPPAFVTDTKTLSIDTIKHLKSAWSEYIYREERIPVDESVQACRGLASLFFYLCGSQSLKDFIGAKSALSIVYDTHEDKNTIEQQRSGDVWSAFLSVPDGKLVTGDIPTEFNFQRHFSSQDPDQTYPDYPSYKIKMGDTSSKGCRLHWESASENAPVIGELVGLCRSSTQDHWQIGEVAWKDVTSTGAVVTGIRLLSTSAIPVALDIPLRLARNENYASAILFPPEENLGTRAVSILLSPIQLKQGEYLTISQKGIEEKIHLNKAIKLTDAYENYECAFVVKNPSLGIVRPK